MAIDHVVPMQDDTTTTYPGDCFLLLSLQTSEITVLQIPKDAAETEVPNGD